MNTTLIWLLAVPVILALVVFYVARQRNDMQQSLMLSGGFALAGILITCMCFFISTGAKSHDTEIWNGQVTGKSREHGTYEESYQCNCRTITHRNSDGTTSSRTECDTCYRTHYTVEWTAHSTVGNFQIRKLDETSRSVYSARDPMRYVNTKVGDPAASAHSYINYVQAVPNSLFTPAAADLKKQFAGLIPKYPDRIYDLYNVNRFVSPGWAPSDADLWNQDISNSLRELGPKKQVNLIVVVAKTNDVNYEYALRDAWEGANKNDVVLIIGSTEYPKIDFVRVLSWTKNEAFKIQLRDAVMDKGTIDRSIVQMCAQQIDKNFERRHMKEFAYLEGEIDPPDWLIYALLVLLIGGAIGMCVVIQRK